MHHLDINNTILNGFFDEIVYMQQPPDFESPDSPLVCKLNKVLYSLKHAPRQWFEKLQSTLLQLGFTTSKLITQLNQTFTLKQLGSLPHDHRFTSGVVVFLGPNLIFLSCKQPIVARSNTETEYQSLA
uniref:Retrovirus-related Pol polyprotein from transposon TNT 1-94 n=1 Tax=Cajanus cajan TaxID=3821 RepID=A0A151QVN9_CAJCA|nr:Retrovirus-related Pol polyprotein from transposon TNT 1-94 [Cajanus cajan]